MLKNMAENSKEQVNALKLTIACGLNLRKVMAGGPTVVHLAPQYCSDNKAITHLLAKLCVDETPLHYIAKLPLFAKSSQAVNIFISHLVRQILP